jgi:hypothetical protein
MWRIASAVAPLRATEAPVAADRADATPARATHCDQRHEERR